MRIDDRLTGLIFAVLGCGVIFLAQQLPAVPGTTFGPNLMPTLIGVAMLGLSLKIMIAALRTTHHGPWFDISAWQGRTRGIISAIWTMTGVLVAIYALPVIGFPLLGLVYTIGLMLLLQIRLVIALPVGLIVILGLQYVFAQILYVPLSAGPLPLPW
ncbi:tripartite tricarboxylate transporter TctB family protein [Thalassospira mesophila]|uniref:tripartite tricarboxylate transporter TctB family protein n=1 Tax=Thalassospira mesophila TaxID=1293891 RepID=UPI000A1F0300|nr:tripartite tricarboxylate transporter TctB family protein [Thalassospira mesophila]